MSKQLFESKVINVNAHLAAIGIPLRFTAGKNGHPTLSITHGDGLRQVRKGNYAQVYATLESEFQKLDTTFCNRPVMVRIATATEAIEKQYTGKTSIVKFVQRVVTEAGVPAQITINGTYVFTLNP